MIASFPCRGCSFCRVGNEEFHLAVHLQHLQEQLQQPNLLKVQPARQWLQQASQRPIPTMRLSEFWLAGELCMRFADTNLGKSILAVQLGDSISRGIPIPGFE